MTQRLDNSLNSINIIVNYDDKMVQISLDNLTHKFESTITRENPASFFDLQSMLMVEENHMQLKSTTSNGWMLYTQEDLDRGHDLGNQ